MGFDAREQVGKRGEEDPMDATRASRPGWLGWAGLVLIVTIWAPALLMLGRVHGTFDLCGRVDEWTYAGVVAAFAAALVSQAAIIHESGALNNALAKLRDAG